MKGWSTCIQVHYLLGNKVLHSSLTLHHFDLLRRSIKRKGANILEAYLLLIVAYYIVSHQPATVIKHRKSLI